MVNTCRSCHLVETFSQTYYIHYAYACVSTCICAYNDKFIKIETDTMNINENELLDKFSEKLHRPLLHCYVSIQFT